MNIDVYNTQYTFEEIAQQCKDAVLNNQLRGKVAPANVRYVALQERSDTKGSHGVGLTPGDNS